MGRPRKYPRFEDHSPSGQVFIVILVVLVLIGMVAKFLSKH
jgi:hypothetical protein